MQSDFIQLLGIILAFGLIIGLVMRRFNYGLALILGSLVLGFSFGFSTSQFVQLFLSTLMDPITHDLALVIALIPILTFCMTETGMFKGLVESLKDFLSSRSILAVVPAIFGLLPTPGGALFSAPIIDGEAEMMGVETNLKVFINVWFRHCVFLIYPMNAMMILTSRLAGIDVYNIVLVQIPIFVAYVLAGYFTSIFRIKSGNKRVRNSPSRSALPIFVNISPLLLVILLNALGVHMALALGVGIGWVLVLKRANYKKVFSLIWHGFDWKLVFAIFGVMFFRHVIEASGALDKILSYIGHSEIHPLLFLIPFSYFSGAVMAMPTAAIAIILPIAVQILGKLTPIVVSMLFVSVFFAYLISPMHLCLVLTMGYYKGAQLQRVYRLLIPLSLFVALIGMAFAYGFLMRF